MRRNRRAGVEDRWTKTVRDEHGNTQKVPSARDGIGTRWLARYVDERGREHTKLRLSSARLTLPGGSTARRRRSSRARMSRLEDVPRSVELRWRPVEHQAALT